jgi:hypothetical protein
MHPFTLILRLQTVEDIDAAEMELQLEEAPIANKINDYYVPRLLILNN